MKLKKLKIHRFKKIRGYDLDFIDPIELQSDLDEVGERCEFDFTDGLGRVRDMVVLGGPNGCGKTTALDAIAYSLSTPEMSNAYPMRIKTELTEKCLVELDVTFSGYEYTKTFKVDDRLKGADKRVGHFIWQYPSPRDKTEGMETSDTGTLMGKLIDGDSANGEYVDISDDTGYFFYFRQERHWARTRQCLIKLAREAEADRNGVPPRKLEIIQEGYAKLFTPRRLVGLRSRDGVDDIFFEDENGHGLWFDQLSSGEKQCLIFIVQIEVCDIHHSLVLIDTIETHLHPPLQLELLKWIRRETEGNQFIIATHSSHIFDFLSTECRFSIDNIEPLIVGLA